MKFYGTMICPDCVDAVEVLKADGVEYEFIDITENTDNMKEFLKLRDTREEFKEVKEAGNIGIPCFLKEDGSVSFDYGNEKPQMCGMCGF